MDELRVSHDRLTFILSDWRRPILLWGLAGLAVMAVMLLAGVELAKLASYQWFTGFCLLAWLFANRRTVHLTPDQLEIVDADNFRSKNTRRYPLHQIASHSLIEVNGRPRLRIDLPDRSLALPGERHELELAAAMLEAARQSFVSRDAGSQKDVPAGLRQVARAARTTDG
jgi:hypothetical protein